MRRLRGILLLALGAALLAPPAAAQQPDDLQARAARVLAQQQCQTELPGERATGGSAEPEGHRPRRAGMVAPDDREAAPPQWQASPGLGAGTGFATLLLWVFLVVAGLLLLALIVRAIADRRPATSDPGPVRSTAVAAAAPATVLAADDESLAAAGRFGEAIHALLQRALLRLAERGAGLRPSTTGREALHVAAALPAALPDGVPSLRVLVQEVERSRFGGRTAARVDYDASKQAFARWSAACEATR